MMIFDLPNPIANQILYKKVSGRSRFVICTVTCNITHGITGELGSGFVNTVTGIYIYIEVTRWFVKIVDNQDSVAIDVQYPQSPWNPVSHHHHHADWQ